MSEGYDNFENGSESNNTQYTQAPSGNDGGYSYGGPVNDYSSGKGQGKGLGIASMVCGILSIVLVCCSGYIPFLPIVLGVVAVILGIVQIVKNESKGMAIAGIICGAIGVVMYIALLIIGFAVLGALGGELDYNELLRQLEDMENSLRIRL